MSRLIDADANREKFKEIVFRALNDYTIATKRKFNLIMTAFDNIPTAYDVEKVVKELKEWTFNADINIGDGTMMNHNLIVSENAIDTVREGGVE